LAYPLCCSVSSMFSLNAPATTGIYTLSLHDALPISDDERIRRILLDALAVGEPRARDALPRLLPALVPDLHARDVAIGQVIAGVDRKSTRLNSSHVEISYAVFCLKKKKKNATDDQEKLHGNSTEQMVLETRVITRISRICTSSKSSHIFMPVSENTKRRSDRLI